DLGAGREIAAFPVSEPELGQHVPGLDPGRGEVAAHRLRQPPRLAPASRALQRPVAVARLALHLRHPALLGLHHRTRDRARMSGIETPSSVKTRVMPHLRPTRPIVMSYKPRTDCDWPVPSRHFGGRRPLPHPAEREVQGLIARLMRRLRLAGAPSLMFQAHERASAIAWNISACPVAAVLTLLRS